VVTLAQAMGNLSLALRSLGDNETVASASGAHHGAGSQGTDDDMGTVSVIRYGRTQRQAGGGGQ
jgi:Flp pilus assembly protein CpaB